MPTRRIPALMRREGMGGLLEPGRPSVSPESNRFAKLRHGDRVRQRSMRYDRVLTSTARKAMGGRSLRTGHFLPVAGALLVCILAGAGWAQSSNPKAAINWLRKCTSPEDYGQIECLGYVRALVEYDQLRGELGERRHICL